MTRTTTDTTVGAARTRRRSRFAALLAVPALCFALAACGPASASGSPEQSTGPGSGELTRTEWQLKYSQCMRGEGIDMPDPDANGGIAMRGLPSGSDADALQAAADKCRAELGEMPPLSEAEQKAADEQYVAWGREIAQCYRDNGFDMPDPKAGEELQFPADTPDSVQDECGGAGSVTKRVQG